MAAAAIIDGRRIFMVRSNPRKRFLFDGALKVEEAARVHVDPRIGRGTGCRNQLEIAVITVAVVVVVYIE